jgi:hypothetical protein
VGVAAPIPTQAVIPNSMAAAITMDNSLNIFVVISFSFYLVFREIAVRLTDFVYKVGVAVFLFVNFFLLSLNSVLSRRI